MPKRATVLTLLLLSGLLSSCNLGGGRTDSGSTPPASTPPALSNDGRCSDFRDGFKNVYFGDLHTHTSYSLDAYFFNALTDPAAAHRFAKGEAPLPQPAPGSNDVFTQGRELFIDRPLDFNAVTDHAEFLGGFKLTCDNSEATQQACDRAIGQGIRDDIVAIAQGDTPFQTQLAQSVINQSPSDMIAWQQTKAMNDAAYEPCLYTTLHAYEFTSNEQSQMFHRNVIFNGPTEAMPLDVMSAVKPTTATNPENGNDDWDLFDYLQSNCLDQPDCEVLTIPHNPNLSDGRMFLAGGEASGMSVLGELNGAPLGRKVEFTSVYFPMTAEDANLRRSLDRSFEMTQHKGQSECAIGLDGNYLANDEGYDPACGFEINKSVCLGNPEDPPGCAELCQGRPEDPNFCHHRTPGSNLVPTCTRSGPDGSSGTDAGTGNCSHPLDYYRNAMAEGLKIKKSLGVNPYKLNITASLDTHNADSGNSPETNFVGHTGVLDDEPYEQLGFWACDNQDAGEDPRDPNNCTNRIFLDFARTLNPGGLSGVWAPQNTRNEVWQAIHRGESFGTSGPRMRVRSIASWDALPSDICARLASGEDLIASGQIPNGARMGGDLPPAPAGAGKPWFAAVAIQDPEGYPLQSLDIIKGYLDASGAAKVRVMNGVSHTSSPITPPSHSDCSVAAASHPSSLCAVWQDEEFAPERGDSFWYARAREVPSCRWSTYSCNIENAIDCSLLDPANGQFPEDSGMSGFEGCCITSGEPGSFSGVNHFHTIEERAWASPVWYDAP